ncbi:hypothetical protein CRENBAI_017482 [Crenichthys baileyi]|uniref:Uncharacterized protein n=1 Tax=Crenichthys baileyi TaxID=28760 RepID=A0AAV9QW21_9TELE
MTAGTSQQKDQAADEEMITLSDYLRRAAEKSVCQAEEAEEQRSPFWGSRLAILLTGTGPQHHTSSLSSQPGLQTGIQLPPSHVLGAAHFLCPVRDSSMPPPQPFCSSSESVSPENNNSCQRRCRRKDSLSPIMEIRTGASLSFPEGLATAPSSCLASPTSFPGFPPCPSDHSVPPSGSWQKDEARSAPSVQLGMRCRLLPGILSEIIIVPAHGCMGQPSSADQPPSSLSSSAAQPSSSSSPPAPASTLGSADA